MRLPKKYPAWFPYPSSWLRALALMLIGFPLSLVVLLSYFILLVPLLSDVPVFIYILAFLVLTFIISIFSYLYYLFWYKSYSNRLNRKLWSVWEGGFATVVLTLSFLSLLTIFLPVFKLECQLLYPNYSPSDIEICIARKAGRISGEVLKRATFLFDTENNRGIIEKDGGYSWGIHSWVFIWLIFAAYPYQIENIFLHKFILKFNFSSLKNLSFYINKNNPKKPKNQKSSSIENTKSPIIKTPKDEIDQELQELKRKMGLKK